MTVLPFLAAIAIAAPPPGAPTIATRVTAPATLHVGDRFEVRVTVDAAHPSLVTGPLADTLGAFLVTGEKRSAARRGDRDATTYRLTVAAFRTGRLRLPAFAFLVSSGTRADTLRTAPESVSVASVMPQDMKDVRPLKPAEDFPNWWLRLLPVGLLLLALLAWLGRRLFRRMRALQDGGAPALPPWEEAIGALDALPWRDWVADGQARRLHYALSEILKRYIERRFEFAAVEQTTTEILASMRERRLPMREDLGRFFARADLVKYAKLVPPADEAEAAVAQVRAFVERTRPQPEPVPAAPGAAAGGAS